MSTVAEQQNQAAPPTDPISFADAVPRFLEYVRSYRSYSPGTVRAYARASYRDSAREDTRRAATNRSRQDSLDSILRGDNSGFGGKQSVYALRRHLCIGNRSDGVQVYIHDVAPGKDLRQGRSPIFINLDLPPLREL